MECMVRLENKTKIVNSRSIIYISWDKLLVRYIIIYAHIHSMVTCLGKRKTFCALSRSIGITCTLHEI